MQLMQRLCSRGPRKKQTAAPRRVSDGSTAQLCSKDEKHDQIILHSVEIKPKLWDEMENWKEASQATTALPWDE